MVEEAQELTAGSAEEWLAKALRLVPAAIERAQDARGFAGRWKLIASKLERIPPCLSDLSSHPFFARHALCRELLQSVAATVSDAVRLADRCNDDPAVGKLQMQSDLDALAGRLDLSLRDCSLLVKTGVLGESAARGPSSTLPKPVSAAGGGDDAEASGWSLREMLARLQIGNVEAKHRALDGLLEALREDKKNILAVIGRSNVAALVQLLTATTTKIREKAATAICLLTVSGNFEGIMVNEGVLPPLIRLLESGSAVGREKAVIALQRLSMSNDTARSIAGHGGAPPLIEVCQLGDSICQSAAAGALKNISAVPEVRKSLVDEGIVRVMINLLDSGAVTGAKEYAAECLQNLTATNESLRRLVISEGGIQSLLKNIDGPLPQESAVGALKNLVCSVSIDNLMSLGILPRLVHALKDGSLGAQQAAAATICRISGTMEMKRLVGEFGCIPLLVKMLETKASAAREVAAQAVSSLISCPQNAKEIKKNEQSVPNLVQLLDPSLQNTAKKYAVSGLLHLSSSRKLKKMMISYGAIGYLKKLSDMDVPGAKKLLERLKRGKLPSLFSKKK